jgi:zinc protease
MDFLLLSSTYTYNMKKKVFTALMLMLALMLQAQTLLPQDNNVRKGVLTNGLTYYIRHNSQTPHIADFYIAQRVGSILEEPRQRGLAHFLEHMAFNGTITFPGDSLHPGVIKWCETVGIKFGQNLNAYTSVDQTVYNISSAPVIREGVVDSCLLILHDWSHDLLLSDKEIDKERGVVHEEWRTRRASMAMQRLMEQSAPVIYKGTKYEDCLPIGNMDIVDHFPYQDLRDYYHKWYRPDLQAIIVVGDIDPDKMEQKIKDVFGTIPAAVNPAERIYYPVTDNDKIIVYTAKDKEQPTVNFTLYMKRDVTPRNERNTEKYYVDGYKSMLIRTMLNRRLQEIAQQPNPAFISASVRDGSFFLSSTKDAFTGTMMCKENLITEGITAFVAELERARTKGFTAAELARAKADQMKRIENAYAERDKKRNGHYVSQCLNNFLENEPILSAETEFRIAKNLNESLKRADINAAVRELITDKNQVVTLYGPEKGTPYLPSDDAIRHAITNAQYQKYKAYTEKRVCGKLISKVPKAGNIVSEHDTDFGYHEILLSNGMKVYAKSTDYEADKITMNMFSLGGKSLYPDSDMPSLSYLASSVAASGVSTFDAITLKKLLAGKTVSVSPFIGEETEGISGSCSVNDLPTMMELTHLYFTSPRRDDAAFSSLMNRQRAFLTHREANPKVSYNDSLIAILYGNDPRLAPIKQETLSKVNYDRILQIYKERFANAGDFNLILTGNVDLRQLRPLLKTYLASLPASTERDTVADTHTNVRKVNEVHLFTKAQQTPSSLTTIIITTDMPYTAENDLKLDVLGQALRLVYTEKVREDKGGTYGVSVSEEMQSTPHQEAYMNINFRTDPTKYKSLIPIIYEQLELMAKNGPTNESLNKIKEYELKTYDQNKILNSYWNYIMYNYLFNHVDLDKDYKERVSRLTVQSIRDFAADLLRPNHKIEVTMMSE